MAQQRFLSISDLSHMPKPTWMIEGIFEANTLVMLAGPPASFKSFLAIDWMMCMAAGRKWNNKPTIPARVLYVLGEGKASLLKRLDAWMHYNNTTKEDYEVIDKNFRVSLDVPQLAMKSSVDNMLAGLERENYSPNVIVIDTFARSFVGLDENSQKDTGMWVENADRLRQLGYTVIFLHHTAKNTEFGVRYRGSTAIMGAMDTAMTMTRDLGNNKLALTITKQKDHDEGSPMYFNRLIVKPDINDPEGSCVLTPAAHVDERFTPEHTREEGLISDLIDDHNFASDRARSEELARQLNITDSAAQSRVSRYRKEYGIPLTKPEIDDRLSVKRAEEKRVGNLASVCLSV